MSRAKHCGELYFQRQCFQPTTYITSRFSFRVECSLSRESAVNSDGTKWDQTSEKLGLQALVFNHPLDRPAPGTGIHVNVRVSNGGIFQTETVMGASNFNRFPWTYSTGWNTAADTHLKFRFGAQTATYPVGFQTFYVRGMAFSKDQFRGSLKFKMRINYNKDSSHEVGQAYNPALIGDNSWYAVTVQDSDLDDSGLFFFKDPNDASLPIEFACMILAMKDFEGPDKLNFDFVGTYYDFDTAVDGKHADDLNDEYNSPRIGHYLAALGKSNNLCSIIIENFLCKIVLKKKQATTRLKRHISVKKKICPLDITATVPNRT